MCRHWVFLEGWGGPVGRHRSPLKMERLHRGDPSHSNPDFRRQKWEYEPMKPWLFHRKNNMIYIQYIQDVRWVTVDVKEERWMNVNRSPNMEKIEPAADDLSASSLWGHGFRPGQRPSHQRRWIRLVFFRRSWGQGTQGNPREPKGMLDGWDKKTTGGVE